MLKAIKALWRCKLLTPAGIWHVLNSIRLDGINLMALLYIRQKLSPQQTAIIATDYTLDYRTLYKQSQHLANQLFSHCHISPRQKIAVMATNHALLVHTLFALAALGADVYLLNTEISSSQLSQINDKVQFDWIIHDPEISTLPAVKTLPTYHDNLLSIQTLLRAAPPNNPLKRPVTHFSKITVLTSGTTGRFKLAERSSQAQNFISPFYQLLVKLNLSDFQRIYLATPIYHGFGMATLCMSVLLGATIFLRTRFVAEKACHLIADHHIEVVTLVPLMLARMISYSEQHLSSLRCIITGGAPITPALVTHVLNRYGKVLFNLYGTSEAGIAMIATSADLTAHPATIGQPLKGLSAKLMKDGQVTTTQGELYLKCAWSTQGNQWVATGDLACKDKHGYYYLQGRVDDMIISGGENVYPFELETSLLSHPHIADTAVVSVEDEDFGQRLVAFIVLKSGAAETKTTLLDWLRTRIARYQMPKTIILLDELPMTAIGKVDRKKLRQLFSTQAGNENEQPHIH